MHDACIEYARSQVPTCIYTVLYLVYSRVRCGRATVELALTRRVHVRELDMASVHPHVPGSAESSGAKDSATRYCKYFIINTVLYRRQRTSNSDTTPGTHHSIETRLENSC